MPLIRQAPKVELEPPAQTLLEHLGELRRRLAVCVAAFVPATGLGFWLSRGIVGWLKRPAGSLLPTLAFFSPTEALVAYMKVAVIFGIVVTLPLVLYQLWAFVRPGLKWQERVYGAGFVWWGSALFLLGAWLAYAWLLPMFLRFLLTFGGSELVPVISISRYLAFVLGVMVSCGVLFELPLVLTVLVQLGILTPHALRRGRPFATVVLLVIAAVVSPTTDAVSLILMTIPLLLLYELSIAIASFLGRSTRSM